MSVPPNPKPGHTPYTREEIAKELDARDSKPTTYGDAPSSVTTAHTVQQQQLDAQGHPAGTIPPKKKGGIMGIFRRDHPAKAEKELRKERGHAEKAERYAQKARDPALNDKQRRRWLRKTAQQQAAADFHESLKKKHLIAGTPGHKDQAVPAMATHHPIVHDNTNNTVTTKVADQNTNNRGVGAPAFDGIGEVGGAHGNQPHPAVAAVPTHVPSQHHTPAPVVPVAHPHTTHPQYRSTGDDDSSSSGSSHSERNWEKESDSGRSGDEDERVPHRQVYAVKAKHTQTFKDHIASKAAASHAAGAVHSTPVTH